MAQFNFQPTLTGFNFPTQGGLNQNIKSIKPDGTIDLYDDTNFMLGGLGGRGLSRPAQNSGGGLATAAPPQPSTPEQLNGISDYFNSNQGQTLGFLLGQLAQGLALPGSAQAGAGAIGAQFFQNQIFNQLLQGALSGNNPNPFSVSSAALGPGVAALTPEMQQAILSASQTQSQIPAQNFLRTAQGIEALTPKKGNVDNLQRVTSSLPPGKDGLPDPNGKVDPRKEYIYSIDPTTNQIGKYITTQVKPEPAGSDSAAREFGLSDIEKSVGNEFYSIVQKSLQGMEVGKARAILDQLTDKQTGTVVLARLIPYLDQKQRVNMVESIISYAKYSKNPDAIKNLASRLGEQVGLPPIGTVRDGYEYLGGDPNKQNNWKKVGE